MTTPQRPDTAARVAELHRLAAADYAKGQAERAAVGEPTDLHIAISVAQQLVDSDQVLALQESLRLLLRALGAEPTTPPATVAPPAQHCPAAHPDDLPDTRHSPLRAYAVDLVPLDPDTETRMASEALAETDDLNIHSHDDMIGAAVNLSMRLRSLTTSLAARVGEGR